MGWYPEYWRPPYQQDNEDLEGGDYLVMNVSSSHPASTFSSLNPLHTVPSNSQNLSSNVSHFPFFLVPLVNS